MTELEQRPKRERRKKSKSREDKRKLCFSRIEAAADELPGYSTGDILYAALRLAAASRGGSVSFLLRMDDKELFQLVDKGLSDEFND